MISQKMVYYSLYVVKLCKNVFLEMHDNMTAKNLFFNKLLHSHMSMRSNVHVIF